MTIKASTQEAILAGSIVPTIFKLALPTVVVLVAQTAVSVAEAAYVGRLGTAPLAGVALVFPLYMLMITMSNGGIGSGVASALARATGSGRKVDASALLWHAVVISALLGLLFAIGAWVFGRSLYRAMGGEGEALEAAVLYSNWLFAGAIPVWIVNLLSSAMRGSGNVIVPALVTLIGAMILIPTSPALIFGFGLIPKLGIAGAGMAYAIYYLGACTLLLRYMRRGGAGLTLAKKPLRAKYFKDILGVGIPAAVTATFSNLTVIIVTAAVGVFGTHAIAGYGNAARLDYVLIPILFGLAAAVLTMVGINLGAGNVDRARRIAWLGGLIGSVLTGLIGLLAAFFPDSWLHLFSQDAQVLEPARIYLQTVAPFYCVYGFGFVLMFAVQGTGNGLWGFMASALRMLIAAGAGWVAVTRLNADMQALAWIVASSYIGFCAVTVVPMFSKRIFPR